MNSSNDFTNKNLEAIQKWYNEVGLLLVETVTPIYKDGPRHPALLGSGMLLRFGEVVCVMTAAHVADDVISSAHYFGAGGELHPLGGLKFSSPLHPNVDRDADRVDLAFWVVTATTAAKLEQAEAITLEDFDLILPGAFDLDESFFVCGYPATRQPRRMNESEYGAKPFSFITEELLSQDYNLAGLERIQNLMVAFDKADVFRGQEKVGGPDLFGVSGGGIWRLTGLGTSLARPKLAGLVISWNRGDPKAIIGTRAHVMARGIVHSLQRLGLIRGER
jgi:hypothetical protein